MQARIYKRPKNAMQSGKALTDQWILDFVPAEAKKPDPLMGWAGSGDTRTQVQLRFASCEAAQAYAAKYGIDVQVPGMIYAALRQVPAQGGRLKSYDFDAVKDLPGVRGIAIVDPVQHRRG